MDVNLDKIAAAKWAADVSRAGYVIFDTETTGLGPDAEIVQIGILDHTGAALLNTLIKPVGEIDPKAAAVHGIDAATVANAPTLPEVWPIIRAALYSRNVVAYNMAFDWRLLEQSRSRYWALEPIEPRTKSCAMLQYAAFWGDWNEYHGNYKWQRLEHALGQFGLLFADVAGREAHDALADCRGTNALMGKMVEWYRQYSALGIEDRA